MQELKGLGVALVTPFQADGLINYSALERLVKHVLTGADYLVVMGTTGESVTISWEDQMAVLGFVKEITKSRIPIVFGLGGAHTAGIAERMRAFDKKGVSAFLSVSPAYTKPTQEGIYRHYLKLADASRLPIIIYNVPGRTSSNVLPATVRRIASDAGNVIGIKEAAGNIEQVMELARLLPENFLLISGDDALLLPHLACGGHGIISVVGNAFPRHFAQIMQHAREGQWAAAKQEHLRLLPLIRDLFAEGNPGGIKEVLKHLSICDHHMRLPLWPVSKELSQKLYRHVAELT